MHISETPPNQPGYPWFSKCPLNLGLEKPILINSADMSHLPPSATGLIEISQNSQESTCARVSFLIKLHAKACNFIKKETLAQMFSCEF